jgi:hypothetical protein
VSGRRRTPRSRTGRIPQERPRAAAEYPRRRTSATPADPPEGWRGSKRSSKLGKQRRRQAKSQAVRERIDSGVRSAKSRFIGVMQLIGMGLAALVAIALVLLLLATAFNAGARWMARRESERAQSPQAQAEKARENLLIIGANGTGSAEFLAVRLDEANNQVLGIAIPSGAFMEVPGQGFERVGDSYGAGPAVSAAAVSNYLSVPFENYVVVDVSVYQDALTNQSLRDVMSNVQDSDLTQEDRDRIAAFITTVSGDRTALVPLPVKPIDLGGQTFFEPQRDQIADLLLQWWDVRIGSADTAVRVIIYNGVGSPGIAGLAAQQLISNGMRVVDTKNADRFDYETTLIVVQDGDLAQGEQVKVIIGAGEVIDQPSDQDVADVIVIIGEDYTPPAGDGS